MFEWTYRPPRTAEDSDAVFVLQVPPDPKSMKGMLRGLTKVNKLTTPMELEKLIRKVSNEGQVTRVYVVNRVDHSPLAKLFVETLCNYIRTFGLFPVYSERAGEF